jgi:hypothetical protein
VTHEKVKGTSVFLVTLYTKPSTVLILSTLMSLLH